MANLVNLTSLRSLKYLLPDALRRQLRIGFDEAFCKHFDDKETIGHGSQWTILKRDLGPDSVVYSGGVGENITFELQLIARFGSTVYVFDPSPIAVPTIMRAMTENGKAPSRLVFKPLGLAGSSDAQFSIGGGDGPSRWFKVAVPGTGGTRLPCTSILDQMRDNRHQRVDLLKLDIEGFEYDVLHASLASNLDIRQICVEFHHFFDEIPITRTLRMLRALHSRGFRLIHKQMCDYTFYNAKYLS